MNKKKIFKYSLVFLLLIFIISYIVEQAGYYEYKLQNKTNLTKESIKKFEEDVKKGEDIDIDNYLVKTTTDYTNNFTKVTNKVSNNINNYLKKSIEGVFGIINKLVEDK